MKDKKIRDLMAKIITCGIEKRMDLLSSTHFGNPYSQLEIYAKRILEGKKPTVLWNIRPWNTFNLVHAICCQKLRELIDLGFNITILFYDKFVTKRLKQLEQDVDLAIENNVKWFTKAGLQGSVEFLRESDVWKMIPLYDFLDVLSSICHISEIDLAAVPAEEIPSSLIDNICSIYYEYFLGSDLVLGHPVDIEFLRNLRNKLLDAKIFPDYYPPLIMYFPKLRGIDGGLLRTTDDSNSISVWDDNQKVREKIQKCPLQFVAQLFEYLLFPFFLEIKIHNTSFYYFKTIEEKIGREMRWDDVRNVCGDYTLEYFGGIR